MTKEEPISELIWIRSHVERCLQDNWGLLELVVDGDGDYPYRYGTAACWVRVEPQEPHLVRVFAHAAYGVRRSAKLLSELNEVNIRACSAHVYLRDGLVVVEQQLLPHGVNRHSIAQAGCAVGEMADELGVLIAAVYGGQTPFRADDHVQEETG